MLILASSRRPHPRRGSPAATADVRRRHGSAGSFYPAYRLVAPGLRATWSASDTGRDARFYALTTLGRKQLEEQRANWDRLSAAISGVLGTTE